MINDPFHPEEAIARERESNKGKLLAMVCAVAVTAILLVGYGFVRKYHAQKVLAENTPPPVVDAGPKGPALAHVVLDEPSIAKGMTTIGGVVKNISKQDLTGVYVVIELRRRKDGGLEQNILPVTPGQLQPEQEGSYSVTLPAQNFASIRLAGLKADPQSTLIAYSSSQGKKRTPERLEPKTIVVKRAGKPGEFINTPDTPGRIP
ncbi:MAG TPA: hypothetical protein VE980_06085 [Pyrinomonadaceae bacterium]|jgi:hypothetical protein|nr:hypothetical protein [Pyrinomonadaceae bacterium]